MPKFPSWVQDSCPKLCPKYPSRSPPVAPAGSHSDTLLCRDPSQHSALKDEIEEQSSALYATARLWDDGIIKPTDTRDVVGLGLSLAKKQRLSGKSNTWDGSGNGFGVSRM